jgi:hypothetical protein
MATVEISEVRLNSCPQSGGNLWITVDKLLVGFSPLPLLVKKGKVNVGYPKAAHSPQLTSLTLTTRVFNGFPQESSLVTTNTYIK